MNKSRVLLSCLISIVLAGTASAVWVPLTGEPVPLSSLLGGALVVGDKGFSEFDFFGIGIGGAIVPTADSIFVQGGRDDTTGDYGLRFLCSLGAASGQTVNANLDFKVYILPRYNEWFIGDVSMLLSSASATDTGVVNASESVWDAPIPGGGMLASLSCSKQEGDGGAKLVAYAEFDPVKEIYLYKDLSVTGGIGQYGAAHLSEFFEFYSQVPEPATIALLGLGALVLLRKRRT